MAQQRVKALSFQNSAHKGRIVSDGRSGQDPWAYYISQYYKVSEIHVFW